VEKTAGLLLFIQFLNPGKTNFQATLACEWDTNETESAAALEQPRPEYVAAAREQRRNPITDELESYVPPRTRYQRVMTSIASVTFLIVIVVAVIAGMKYINITYNSFPYIQVLYCTRRP
jgi:hypothetical protein